jgi:hypothetical protein
MPIRRKPFIGIIFTHFGAYYKRKGNRAEFRLIGGVPAYRWAQAHRWSRAHRSRSGAHRRRSGQPYGVPVHIGGAPAHRRSPGISVGSGASVESCTSVAFRRKSAALRPTVRRSGAHRRRSGQSYGVPVHIGGVPANCMEFRYTVRSSGKPYGAPANRAERKSSPASPLQAEMTASEAASRWIGSGKPGGIIGRLQRRLSGYYWFHLSLL